MSTHHPCGALPVRGLGLSVYWCDHHQAFWAVSSRYVQRDGVALDDHHSEVEFGPFDTQDDVARWLGARWVEFLNARRG